jgi:CheY-like chemotaxis protein
MPALAVIPMTHHGGDRFMTTVLVVDDEPEVLEIASEILEDSGYRVVQAAGPARALDLLEHEPAIALLFTDVIMPGMNGFELARRARAMRPSLRVLYTSGYMRDVPAADGSERLLKKPWRATQLEDEVRSALAN